MNTILTIDNGNTYPSAGTFDSDGNLIHVQPLASLLASCDILKHQIVLSDVGRNIPQLDNHPRLIRVGYLRKNNSFLDMPIHYSSTLGEDRLVSAYQVYTEGYERSVLIDSGTFITIDLVDQNGFQGGYIFPGIQTFLNSYATGTNLPQLDSDQIHTNTPPMIPRNTSEALLASCHLHTVGILKEVLSILSPIPRLFLTGGRSPSLRPLLKELLTSDTAVISRPHLIHQALYGLHEH